MFQTFDVSSDPLQGPPRLAALRASLLAAGLAGFLVPRADAHQGEYVAPADARLAWLTGFTGSAGFCAVLAHIAGVFIDGRYRLQVRDQVASDFTAVHWPEMQLADWLKEQLPQGGTIGFDPWLHTVTEVRSLRGKLQGSGIDLAPVSNMVDLLWLDQPDPPRRPMIVQGDDLSGEAHAKKRARLAAEGRHVVITLPDSLCWLLNLRGTDIARNPVVQGFAVLAPDGSVRLFTDALADETVLAHLGAAVTLHPKAGFSEALAQARDVTMQIDPKSAPFAVLQLLTEAEGVTLVEGCDPCILPKACKNPVEVAGAKAAQLRDAVAMVRFLAWLDETAPKGGLSEIDVVKTLEGFRQATNALRDISFETICGAGPNGAIVHYRVTEATNRAVTPGELLLVDSGGQYADGTTDITRTISIGVPGAEERACYTRVLQGMIAISRVQFPRGVSGQHLDALARFPLWLAGMDYDHGTGHGVGSYLSVHEGPQGISRRAETAFAPGMIVSNEPGYYREGAFGIRIENLIVVVPAPSGPDGRDMLAFETLTYVPFDRRLIDISLLSDAERVWIDHYHADTLRLLAGRVDGAALDWLTQACAPL